MSYRYKDISEGKEKGKGDYIVSCSIIFVNILEEKKQKTILGSHYLPSPHLGTPHLYLGIQDSDAPNYNPIKLDTYKINIHIISHHHNLTITK